MTKSAATATSVNLGTKRNCSQCGTKFYDFNRPELICPKCSAKVNPAPESSTPPRREEKRSKVEKEVPAPLVAGSDTEDISGEEGDTFESVEELEDSDEDIVEDIGVEEEESEDEDF